jgi:B12-binding domain/radical SAM domain protein
LRNQKIVDEKGTAPNLPLVFYYHWLNRYSFNALAGAVDGDPSLAGLDIAFASTPDDLHLAAAALLQQHGRVVIALSILTPQLDEMKRLARSLRSAFGSLATVIAGGAHATACAAEVLGEIADVAFIGEAEESFPAVLRMMAEGKDYLNVPGTAVARHGEIICAPRTGAVDLDRFFSFSPKRNLFGPIEITRGCPFACRYCQTPRIFGTRPRHRGVDCVARQAAALRSAGRKVVRLLSPNAFSYGSADGRRVNPDALRDLLSALRETVSADGRIIFAHFPSEVRPEHVTPDTLELMKEFADNDEIVIGAQSGSPRMLKLCRRSHTPDDVLRAVSLARKYGYKVIVDFIFGLPGESPADEEESLSLMERLARLGARVHPHAFAPLPQTAFAAQHPSRISPRVREAIAGLKARERIYINRREILRGIEC